MQRPTHLTRRSAIACAFGASLLPGQELRTYSRIAPDYLRKLAKEAYDRRNVAISILTTKDAIRQRQAWVKDTFWKLVGGRPEACAPDTRVTGQFDRPGYRVEKLVYESQPGLHIPANLYIPAGRGPFPGVLFQMGHSLNGKAADPYQKCCQALARLGYAVLAFDPMGQGERTYYPKPGGTLTRLGSADDEHTTAGKQMLLVGDSATRMHTWDAVVSLNVLQSHPLVDPKRLASTGQSGGGTATMFLAAVDDRLTAAAVSCGNTENFACADFNPPGSVDDAEQNFPGAGPLGFDRWDLLYPLAPKPLLVMASSRDFFGTYSPSYLTSGREEFAKLKRVYETLDAGGALRWYRTNLPHALSKDLRLKIYSFFEGVLKQSARPILDEPEVRPEREEDLYAGKTGNVVRDFSSRTPHSISKARASALRSAGGLEWLTPKNVSAAIKSIGMAKGESCSIETLEIESEPGVWLPVFAFIPATPKSALLAVEPQGRSGRWREGDLYHQLAARGALVVALDVRCVGDLWPEVGRGNPFYTRRHASEDSYAWASLVLGRPLLLQRISDLVAAVRAMRTYAPARGLTVHLAARGHLTVPATFATAIEPAIGSLYTSSGLASFRELVEQEEYNHPFANFIPAMLSRVDIPDVEGRLGARFRKGPWNLEALSALAT